MCKWLFKRWLRSCLIQASWDNGCPSLKLVFKGDVVFRYVFFPTE